MLLTEQAHHPDVRQPHGAAPSVPQADAPLLAALGEETVGYRSISLVYPGQPDFTSCDPDSSNVPLKDRELVVHLWYPGEASGGAPRATYSGTMVSDPPGGRVAFAVPGIAFANLLSRGRGWPLVVVSPGYGNSPVAMTWLTENLASKGYVVACVEHFDPNAYAETFPTIAGPLYYRPTDIAFVVARLKAMLGELIDGERIALIGYSMGGYAAFTGGGAEIDPSSPALFALPGDWLRQLARGGAQAGDIAVPGVKAVVAIAPGGNGVPMLFGEPCLAAIETPLLMIAGELDARIDYQNEMLRYFTSARRADRYLLTFLMATHIIGLNPVPLGMHGSMWDMGWFADPVWRTERVNAINQHFITAFLDAKIKGVDEAQSYLDVPVRRSHEGVWHPPHLVAFDACSPGGDSVTLWKGFQRGNAVGLEMQFEAAAAPDDGEQSIAPGLERIA